MWCSGPGFYGHGFYGMPFFGMFFPILFLGILVFAFFYLFRPAMSRCSISSGASNEELIKEINRLKEEIKKLKGEK
ncbi:hypothetical protein TDSAC_1454 [Thermodesulfobium acidiphilum]|uniref:Uncharacterized protein n=1 Tax=Thermodesulfobium acidiphilum TaxID=1794699 RepID=A0A2R4W227_THEAF|nr:hypothetical protein [Thermodesulfobium acidiphilum]AWB10794.1 hypothetical protein TDSAC_1454 [Thermodesulfobium acidiphilum]